jgi:hypothetical protein
MLAVTNAFENKTADALARISTNLVTAEPSIDGVADALCSASARTGDAERRVAGSNVRWSSDWDASFDDEIVARVADFLRR